ncbi:MAG: hypothetical protein IPN87_16110 [Saprospiraceae bacterium]|nr:hypothetical protein [Candidatus Brachybacter algidus]
MRHLKLPSVEVPLLKALGVILILVKRTDYAETDTLAVKDLTINGIGIINNVKWVFGPDADPRRQIIRGSESNLIDQAISQFLIVENDIGCKSYI